MIDPKDIHAYVDAELSQDEATALGADLASPAAAREIDAIRNLKRLLREKTEAPETKQAWTRCVKRLDDIDRTRRIETVVGRYAPAFCACLFMAIVLVGRFSQHGPDVNFKDSEFARIVGELSPARPTKTESSDLQKYYHERIRQSFTSTPDELSARVIKTGLINGIPVIDFSARDQLGNLDIYVIRARVGFEGAQPLGGHPDLMAGQFNGVNSVFRYDGDSTVLVVAARTFDGLADVAAELTPR